jgi:hypothetical protein
LGFDSLGRYDVYKIILYIFIDGFLV